MRRLTLGHDGALGDESARALAGSPYLSRLETLDLRDMRVGVEGLGALLESPRLAGVTTLDLAGGWAYDHPVRLQQYLAAIEPAE